MVFFNEPGSAYLKEPNGYPLWVCMDKPTEQDLFNNKQHDNNINNKNGYEPF